jgi:hypothetical protein
MGSCLSIPIVYENNPNECFICWEDIPEVYVKCRRCKILLHENCAIRYIINSPQCPHCQRKNALFLYKYEECSKLY